MVKGLNCVMVKRTKLYYGKKDTFIMVKRTKLYNGKNDYALLL